MKDARLHIEGETLPRIVNAAQFERIKDEHSLRGQFKLTCIECGWPVFLNKKGARANFGVVNMEITRRGQRQKLPGFSHKKSNPHKNCSLYFAEDPRYSRLHETNHFYAEERARNLAVLNNPKMAAALSDIYDFYMFRLTGNQQTSLDDKKCLEDVKKKLASMIGVAEYPWLVGVLAPVLIGARKRMMKSGMRRLEFKSVGQQSFPVTGLDGQERKLVLPTKIQLCFSRRGGKEPQPLLRGGTQPVEFEVSRQAAFKIVKTALDKRRAAEAAKQVGLAQKQPVVGVRPIQKSAVKLAVPQQKPLF